MMSIDDTINIIGDKKNPKLDYLAPVSSRPGAVLRQVNFEALGPSRVPFRGGCFVVQKDCISKPDQHEVSECWMVVKGRGILFYDDQQFEINAGDFLYFEPFKVHQVHNNGEQELVIYTVWWLA